MQQVIGDALQASFPPNTTLVSITMEEQISMDTVLVSTSLIIWQAMIPILLANKCCLLEVLYLQHAVARISPNAIGALNRLESFIRYDDLCMRVLMT